MKYLLTMICAVVLLGSCSDDDPPASGPSLPERTVIVYMSAENNLSSYAAEDIKEMLTASETLPDDVNLVAFVDRTDKANPPYIMQIKKGEKIVDNSFVCTEDFYACDPDKMYETISFIMDKYPAESYGLVLWGHAGGWLIESDTIAYDRGRAGQRRAYGVDTGSDLKNGSGNKWINIPSLADVLERLPHKFKFIFADCCNFQCVETAYELRNTAEYIIGSPAETPVIGAPYDRIVPYMFSMSDDFYRGIVDEYNAMVINANDRVPMSVVRTDGMEGLAFASRPVMEWLLTSGATDTNGVIYYRGNSVTMKVMADMNDLLMKNIGTGDLYMQWKAAFDKAVVYKAMSEHWLTDGWVWFDFNVTEERYGGISMFVPQAIYDTMGYDYNSTIKQTQWYYASGMCDYK